MTKDIEKKFISYSKEKDKRIQKLKEIEETKEICFEFIDGAIEKLNNNSPQYVEGYALRIANERRKLIEESEDGDQVTNINIDVENINMDIVLIGINNELKIGEIDCNVRRYEWYPENYYVELNHISLDLEYQNKGYGAWLLKHIPTIINDLYKGRIVKFETTPKVITYNEKIKGIKNWLISNEYKPNGRTVKETGIEFYEIDLEYKKDIENYIISFEESLLDIIRIPKYRNISIEECENIIKVICKNKYSDGISKQKILRLQQIKEKIKKTYDELKENNECIISAIDNVKKLYKAISLENLEINKNDKIDEIAIKLYCKYFKYSVVGEFMAEMGYTIKNKGTNKKRNYIARELKEMIRNSDIENEKLKKYIEYIFIANEGCSNF